MSADEKPPGLAAIDAASEFMKYTLAITAGVLVFGADLITKDVEIPGLAKWLLASSWGALAISIGAGVLAYSRIPIKLAERDYDLHDKYFAIPGRAHQLLFLLGVLLLGTALIIVTFCGARTAPEKNQNNGRSPVASFRAAKFARSPD